MDKPTRHSLTWTVDDTMTAKRIGTAGAKILSTPNMLALMEACALELAQEYLDEGMTTVGAEAHVRHPAGRDPRCRHPCGHEGDRYRHPAGDRAAEDVV